MSTILPTSSRAAAIGVRAVRQYAAAALKPAPEGEASSSAEAGPSRPKPPPTPPQTNTRRPAYSPRLPISDTGDLHATTQTASYQRGKLPTSLRGMARQAAVRKAEAFAKALKAAAPPETVIDHGQITNSPSALKTPIRLLSKDEPTLADLLERKPAPPRYARDEPAYARSYQEVYQSIDDAFIRDQLAPMVKQMGITMKARSAKRKMIPKILSEFGWDPPVYLGGDGPAANRDFHMEESDLFLLLKEEGVLSPLLRKRNPLSFTLVEHPNNTKQNKGEMSGPRWTILRATGDEKSLDYLAGILRSRRATFDTSELGGYHPSSTLMRAIPSAYGCHIEMTGKHTIRLTSAHPATNKRVFRLLAQAASRVNPLPSAHINATILPGQAPFADGSTSGKGLLTLSPFQTSPRDQLPWHISSNIEGWHLARLRRTVVWDAKSHRSGEIHREEKLQETKVWLKAEDAVELGSLGEVVRNSTESVERDANPAAESSVLLTFGHLVTRVRDPLTVALYSGTPGSSTFNRHPSLPNSQFVQFLPNAPPAMIHYPIETTTKRIRRLRYRCIDSGTEVAMNRHLVFTWQYPAKPDAAMKDELDSQKAWMDELNAMMDKAEADVEDDADDQTETEGEEQSRERIHVKEDADIQADLDSEMALDQTPLEGDIPYELKNPITADIHTLSTANLRLPDRPIDVHFAARSIAQIPVQHLAFSLSGVREFFRYLHKIERGEKFPMRPPPSEITYEVEGRPHRFLLLLDEECEVGEVDKGDGVVLRTVKSFEPNVVWSKPNVHTELESKSPVSDTFWRQFAEVSRDVPAGSASALREIPSY